MSGVLGELYSYRNMIRYLVKRDVRGRYKGSLLGFFWNIIIPFVQILVYLMIFTVIFNSGVENYVVYLISGMAIWNWFSESLNECSGVIVANSNMVKKIYFPRSVLVISTVLSKMVNFLILLAIFFVIILLMNHPLSIESLIFLPVVIIISFFFILGISLFLSALDVYLRDIKYLTNTLLMILIWCTPIMYLTENIQSEIALIVLQLNPMTYFVSLFHDILYWHSIPVFSTIIITVILSLIAMIVGSLVFRYLEKDFAEVL